MPLLLPNVIRHPLQHIARAGARFRPGSRVGRPSTGIRLHAESRGQGSPIVFMHGFGANTHSWRHIAPALSRNYRAITVNLKGFGASPKPKDRAYSIRDQAALVRQFLIGEGLRRAILVGHSLGGAVALATALDLADDRDEVLSGLVLIDSIAFPQPLPPFIKILRLPLVGKLSVHLTPCKQQVRSVLGMCYYRREQITDGQVVGYAQAIKTKGGRYALVQTARQIIPPDFRSIIERYPSIRIPTLLIWGRHDRIVPLHLGYRLHDTIRGSEFVVVDDCGHIPQEEKPQETLSAVERFVSQFVY
jgi:pimeloyl-ACP methyl ester carboxylesterase